MTRSKWLRPRAVPRKMPNWNGRAHPMFLSRRIYPILTVSGKHVAGDGYAFNGRGDLISLKRQARRDRARRAA